MDTKAVPRYYDFINRFRKASRFVNERAVFQRALSKRNFRVWSIEKKLIKKPKRSLVDETSYFVSS